MKAFNDEKDKKNDNRNNETVQGVKQHIQGGPNPTNPREYEEQLNTNIRMKKQPYKEADK